jgi:hypothetical protein
VFGTEYNVNTIGDFARWKGPRGKDTSRYE